MNKLLKSGGLVLAGAVAAVTTLLPATAAHAEIGTDLNRWCGNSADVENIEIEEWADGKFKILVTPTYESRFSLDPRGTTVNMWHAIQSCVPGLYGSQADSIWDQLLCHQIGALVKREVDGYASGETYDLESWRQPGANPTNRCGNGLNAEADPGSEGRYYRPDGREPGYEDVAPPSYVA